MSEQTAALIEQELNSIPEKYLADFNSAHEGYAVILEEVRELEGEVFFGEKKARAEYDNDLNPIYREKESKRLHQERMRKECIQVAAMCIRFIQELTPLK